MLAPFHQDGACAKVRPNNFAAHVSLDGSRHWRKARAMRKLRRLIHLHVLGIAVFSFAFTGTADAQLPASTPPTSKSTAEFPDKAPKIGQPLLTEKPPTKDAATVPTERVELFNGKDFAGWTLYMKDNADPAETWSVTNGVIHGTGQPYGYIRTDSRFRNYRLTVEWRFVKVAPKADNTGVLLHVQLPDKLWPRAIECQGQSRHQGDFILIDGATCKVNGEIKTGRAAMQGSPAENPVGEWNTYGIVCAGDTIKASVNGKLMNEATECSISYGHIIIQSEGGEIEVRKVVIEPL
jgi:hypothetical protein